ncbi:secreted serine-rich protein [Streptomyces hygroscopicus subsp. jinggangensis 5008]|nr:secreted serine-rich protein [Streptomyces hygroscopicus subsp. jinggangensis 5008]AGF65046.1 secreted serine-rich protein [Streptomyces hygroscopicus subsp. jinggangensis TL01]
MQRKAYVTGTAALLAALLAGCTSGSGDEGPTDNANPGDAGSATAAAQPGRYRTLPEPCGAVGHDALDALLPGIQQITDPAQRDKAYQGEAALTYDTDRKVGCRWKVESAEATDRLSVDFERVVSYDNTVSDDDQAQRLFLEKETAADLPAPATSSAPPPSSPTPTASSSASASSSAKGSPGGAASPGSATSSSANSPASSGSSGPSDASSGAAPTDLQPRVLTDVGDEAYLDDQLSTSGSTAEQRTVTVVFRTSNVIVTLQYEEQPMAMGTVPDSKEMQDRARNLASRLDDALGG